MKVLSATIVEGKLELPEDVIEEGLTVTVLVPEGNEPFDLTPEQKAFLLESIAQADRGERIDGWRLLDELGDA